MIYFYTFYDLSYLLIDLNGLVTFLRVQQFENSHKAWNALVSKDQTWLHELFAHLMRRKTKTEVGDQLALPQLTTNTIWLSFPPVEGYFYKSTHNSSMKTFFQKLSHTTMWVVFALWLVKYEQRLIALAKQNLKKIVGFIECKQLTCSH